MIRKFKKLRDLSFDDVRLPDEVCITYAVCDEGCGWCGWMLECASEKPTKKNEAYHKRINSWKGLHDQWVLSACTEQICPRCGKTTFRTEVSLVFKNGKPVLHTQTIKPTAKALIINLYDRKLIIAWDQLSERLKNATQSQRMNAVLSPDHYGIHWPDLDEDLSIAGIFRSLEKQKTKK